MDPDIDEDEELPPQLPATAQQQQRQDAASILMLKRRIQTC
jgi:hypothetical protein